MAEIKSGDLAKVVKGTRIGQFGRIVEKASEKQSLYQVEFPYDPVTVFFFEDELEKVTTMPCPECLRNWIETQISAPYRDEEGWAQTCPIHGKIYPWGWSKIDGGETINLLT